MADLRRQQFEFSAEEEDSGSIADEGTKAASVGFDALDLAVEPLGQGVGDFVSRVGHEVVEMPLEHLGGLNEWLQTAAAGPAVLLREVLACVPGVAIGPEPAKVFLDGPGAGGLQFEILQRRES